MHICAIVMTGSGESLLRKLSISRAKAPDKSGDGEPKAVTTPAGLMVYDREFSLHELREAIRAQVDEPYLGVRKAPMAQLVVGVLIAAIGCALLFSPQVQQWHWLAKHQNRVGLQIAYLSEILGVAGLVMARTDLFRNATIAIIVAALGAIFQLAGK